MNEITIQRTPEVIGAEIRTLTEQGRCITLLYAIEIGRRLKEAKEMLSHGEWLPFLERETDFSSSSAARYVKVFEEYGAAQLGIFGPETNFPTLGNLSVSNALRLLSVPAEEREEFVAENDVGHMSARELDRLLKEKAELEERAKVAEVDRDKAEATAQKALEELDAALCEQEKLAAENKDLRSRPVPVAVERDEEAIEQAAKAAREQVVAEWGEKYADLQKKLEKSEAKAAKLKDSADKAAAGAGDKIAAAEKEAAEKIAAAEKEAAQARAELEKLQKELQLASPETTAFSLHFKAVQENFNALFESLEKIQNRDKETACKLTAALDAVLKQFSTRAEESKVALSKKPLPGQMEMGGNHTR